MKLKRILAGVTACTIVGSTMLAMPASATTTTAAKDVKIFDVMNAAKTIAEMDVSDDVKSTLLDKFDTNGNGKIDMTELIAMAQRVAKLNDQDIVNEYGTADETTTTEETTETTVETTVSTDETTETTLETTVSTDETTETTVETSETTETSEETTETTLETTETTEETTTTTAALEPTVAIGDNEYEDGDTVVVEGTDVYSVSVSDENYDVEVALEGSKDADGKDAVRVNGTNFQHIADGKLTITITVPGTDLKKVITLNVKKVKTLDDKDMAPKLVVGFSAGSSGVEISDEFKEYMEDLYTGINEFPATPEEWEEYWAKQETKPGSFVKTDKTTDPDVKANAKTVLGLNVGESATIAGFFDGTTIDKEDTLEKYDTTDTPTYMSTNNNVATVDNNGTITAVKAGEAKIYVVVNGAMISNFDVIVTDAPSEDVIIEATKAYRTVGGSVEIAEGKYVTGVSEGETISLNSLKDAVGEENIRTLTFKNVDGSSVKNLELKKSETKGVIYFVDKTTGTVYYAITNTKGEGTIVVNDSTNTRIQVLDIEQSKASFVVPTGAITVTINGVKSTSEDEDGIKTVYVTEGTTFTLSDIVKVQGVTNPTVTVENSDKGEDTQNVSYDALTKTFTVNDLTKENSVGNAAGETITFSYKVSNTDTRTVKVNVVTVKPALQANPYGYGETDVNGSTVFVEIKEVEGKKTIELPAAKPVYAVNADNEDGSTNFTNVKTVEDGKVTSSDEKIVTIGKTGIELAKNYKPEAGDTVTLTYTFEQGQTVSYTIEVVDALPTVAKNSMVDDYFKYTDKTGTGYQANVAFTGLVKAYDIPDGAELVVDVLEDGTSENVTYMDGKKQVNDTGYTVSAVDIALESAGNNSYTITGIAVGAKDKVKEDTKIAFTVSVVDADGNVITKTENPITVTINPSETPETPVEVPDITLTSATLGSANTVAEYDYTVTDGWTLIDAETKDADGNTVKVVNGKITLTLANAYINTAEKTTTVTLTFTKNGVTKPKEVTLKYTGVVETATIALADPTTAQEYNTNGIAYTLTVTDGWALKVDDIKVYEDENCKTAIETATVAISGTTLTLNVADPGEDTNEKTVYVKVTATKAGQDDTTATLTLKYQKNA